MFPKLNGIDGRKMSKSYNNAIFLSDSEKDIIKKVKGMLTDPARGRRVDPGDPEACNLFPMHKIYSPVGRCRMRLFLLARRRKLVAVTVNRKLADNLLRIYASKNGKEKRSFCKT